MDMVEKANSSFPTLSILQAGEDNELGQRTFTHRSVKIPAQRRINPHYTGSLADLRLALHVQVGW